METKYRTADMGIVCALQCLGFEFDTIERDMSGFSRNDRAVMSYERNEKFDIVLDKILKRKAKVEPLEFLHQIGEMKGRIRETLIGY